MALSVRLTALNPKMWVKTGSNVHRAGIFNEENEHVFLIDPTQISALGGTKSSQLSDEDFLSLRLSPSLDITVSASSHLNTTWSSNGWTVGEINTFLIELAAWCEKHFGVSSINRDLDDVDVVLMQGTVVGDPENTYTVALAYLGNQGTSVGQSLLPTGGLLGSYTLNGNSNDTSGNGYNGIATDVTYVPGRKSGYQAASFNGTTSVINVPKITSSIAYNNPRTLSAWVKFTSVGTMTAGVVGLGSLATTGTAFFIADSGYGNKQWFFWGMNSADINTGILPSEGVWYHTAVTYDGSNIKLFVNGSQIGSTSYSLYTTLTNLYIGKAYGYLYGLVSDVLVYNRALSNAEVLGIYDAQK